jgi:hypothetical protein
LRKFAAWWFTGRKLFDQAKAAMTDWIQIGKARGIPPEDLNRVAAVVEALEAASHPLAQQIPPETEPALVLSE